MPTPWRRRVCRWSSRRSTCPSSPSRCRRRGRGRRGRRAGGSESWVGSPGTVTVGNREESGAGSALLLAEHPAEGALRLVLRLVHLAVRGVLRGVFRLLLR